MGSKFLPEEQNLVSYSLMGPESGGPCLVDSNQNRITRIRPYAYDKEYTDAHCNPWKIEARGQTFTPPDRVTITPLGLGYKSRVYSPGPRSSRGCSGHRYIPCHRRRGGCG